MLIRLLACTILAASLAPGIALAEQNNTYPSKSNTMNNSAAVQNPQQLPEQIKSKLRQDGFTDVKVIPGSFLVSAKDKNGDNVNMVIGPNSILMLTQASGSSSATTGSGTSQSNMQNSVPSNMQNAVPNAMQNNAPSNSQGNMQGK
jgi:hypothetical protein